MRKLKQVLVNLKDSKLQSNRVELATFLDSQENEYNYMKNCPYKKEHYEKFFKKEFKKWKN